MQQVMRASIVLAVVAACHGGDRGGVVDAPWVDEDWDAGQPFVCHFPSGRPCAAGDICMNVKGSECEPVLCNGETRRLEVGGAAACVPGQTDPVPGGPFDCDPAHLDFRGGITPPPAPCRIGALFQINGTTYGMQCVPVSQCLPLPCDPQYSGDGCPSNYACDATTLTCVPAS
jgi:hypothetical protein